MATMAARRMPSRKPVRSPPRAPSAPEAPRAQQQRHHQVVADHGRHGDGLDDDHAGGRRQPADEGQQRQRRCARRPAAATARSLRHSAPAPKCSSPPSAIGSTNRLISSRYSGNTQAARLQVPLVDVLDHHHLELARQEDHRQHRQQRQREPLLVGEGLALARAEQRAPARAPPGRGRTGRPGRRTGPRRRRRRPPGRPAA